MTDDPNDDRYLWDRSGPPDPEVARLEALLGSLAHRQAPPVWPARRTRRLRMGGPALRTASAAAVVVLVALGAWFMLGARGGGWSVQNLAGAPLIDGVAVADGSVLSNARLRIGGWLVTDGLSRARIDVGQIGRVEVDPNTRLQLVAARSQEHRLSLTRGTIHARIWAPPKRFYVDTPSAVAIDLGCAYTLQVEDSGAGLIRVTSGWVGFESNGRESFIPEGAICATRPGTGPGTPRYDDAPSGYGEALDLLDFGNADDPRRAAMLDLVLGRARQRDALTLWHLLARGTADERARVFARMVALAPLPSGVTREAVLRGDRAALDQWWDTLGLENASWWRLWKKRW